MSRRRRDKEEATIWKKIQTKTMTRMITTVYAHAFLYLVLSVQVRVLGGRLSSRQQQEQQQQEQRRSPQSQSPQDEDQDKELMHESDLESHRMVLTQTFQTFFRDGIPKLIQAVEAIVEVRLQDWNVIVDDEDGEEEEEGEHAEIKTTDTHNNDNDYKDCYDTWLYLMQGYGGCYSSDTLYL